MGGRFRSFRRTQSLQEKGDGCYCEKVRCSWWVWVEGRKVLGPKVPPDAGGTRKGLTADKRRREIRPAGLVNSPIPSSGGAAERGVARLREKSNLRGKKLDPWQGANAAPKVLAVLLTQGGDPQNNPSLGNSRGWVNTVCGAPVPAGTDRTRQRGFTQQIAIRDGCGGPAMRPRPRPRREARAVNSVGELAAEGKSRMSREIDPGAKWPVTGKESVASSHTRMNPWRQNLQGFFFLDGS